MNQPSSYGTSQTTTQSQSFSQLQKQLSDEKKKESELLIQQAENKLTQEGLKKVIDAISKNLEEFKKDGEALGKEFYSLKKQVENKLHCVKDLLGNSFDAVHQALKTVNEAVVAKEKEASEIEKKVSEGLEAAYRDAKRTALRDQIPFDQLSTKALKERLSQAQGLWKEANAISGDSPADNAAAYSLLWLALEPLSKTLLLTEVDSKVVDFKFPSNLAEYETQLVEAYDLSKASAIDEAKAQKSLESTKSELNQAIKGLGTLRGQRKEDAVAAAKKAAHGCSASAKDETARR
jgi:hypothetical protein